MFTLSIGRRVLNRDLVATGSIPVYSANVHEPFGMIDKLLIEEFNTPSILWGIDGDWMVNFIEKGNRFYPTDHCGVLRVDEGVLNPHFVMYQLQLVGEKVGFSRTYRASIDRIEALSIPAVSLDEQNTVMREVEQLEAKISEELQKIAEIEKKRKDVMNDIFS